MLIWTNFDSFAITDLMQVASFKNRIKAMLNSLQTQGPGTSFQTAVF